MRFCRDPKYRSVVWMDAWQSSNWICFRSPPDSRHNLAQVLLIFMGSKFIGKSGLPCVLRHDMPDHSLSQRHRVFFGYFRRRTCRNSGPSDKPAAAEHAVRADIHEQFGRYFTKIPPYRQESATQSRNPLQINRLGLHLHSRRRRENESIRTTPLSVNSTLRTNRPATKCCRR